MPAKIVDELDIAENLGPCGSLCYNIHSTYIAFGGAAVTPRQIESALSRAQVICKMRGARLTPVRRRVLELIGCSRELSRSP